ncbi:MAG TPA: hypothetical protein VKK79_11345 [Candidatus Lokiarchaeia archaeon]|nr:hypothetical protein [Candidatus Lokiarchaeia archaeon]
MDKKSLEKNKIHVLLDGTPMTATEWKAKKIKDSNQMSILVPLFGG